MFGESTAKVFLWTVVREARRHRTLAILNIVSVALGVTVFLAIQIVNRSASRSFEAGIDLVAGRAHLEIRGDIDERIFPKVAAFAGVEAATPLVEGLVTLPDRPGEYLRVLGVDPFTDEPFRTFEIATRRGEFGFERWLGQPDVVALAEELADRWDLESGTPFEVFVDGRVHELEPGFRLKAGASASSLRFAAMDIGWAQELFGKRGRLSAIQVRLADPDHPEPVVKGLQAMLPADVTVEAPKQRAREVQQMLAAFRLNLSALSLVSMFVGMFLIYNSVSASVVRRRGEIGSLRAIGASRGQIRGLFLGEACVYGVIGLALGAALGVGLAALLVGSVARTITSLYVLVSIERLHLEAGDFLLAGGLGMVAVLGAAWYPARQAAALAPVEALFPARVTDAPEHRQRIWLLLAGLLLMLALIASVYAVRATVGWASFAAALFTLSGASFLAPATATLISAVAGRLPGGRRALLVRLGARNLRRAIHRNAVTVASLGVALAMLIGVTVMVHSFRRSVEAWISQVVVADLFVAPAANEVIGLNAFISEEARMWFTRQPEVKAVDTFREIRTRANGTPVEIAAVEGAERRNLRFKEGGDRRMERFHEPGQVFITESLGRRLGVGTGDVLSVETPRGTVPMTVAGVYFDYTSDRGVILMSRANYLRYWDDRRVHSLAITLTPQARPDEIAARFRAALGRQGEYAVYSNRALRARILDIFDQTFAVTNALRGVALVVGVAGVFLSMTVLVMERVREIGVMRSIGASRTQVAGVFLSEAGLIGGAASLLGIAAGCVLAMILTWVVNPAFFGWTISLEFPWGVLAWTPVWIISVAILAALWPSIRAAQTNVSEAIREE